MAFYGCKLTFFVCSALVFLCLVYYYGSQDTADIVCERTLQSRLLEWLSGYIHGLSCGNGSSLRSQRDAGISDWIQVLIRRAHSILKSENQHRSEEFYTCRLEWAHVLELDFSVKAYHCGPVVNKTTEKEFDWRVDLAIVIGCALMMLWIVDYIISRQIKSMALLEAAENSLNEAMSSLKEYEKMKHRRYFRKS